MPLSARRDLTIEKGATFRRVFTMKRWVEAERRFVPVDFTGYSGRMQVRSAPDSDLLLSPTVTVYSELDADDVEWWKVSVLVTAAATAALDWTECVYDLELYTGSGPSEEVVRLLKGSILADPEVTHA